MHESPLLLLVPVDDGIAADPAELELDKVEPADDESETTRAPPVAGGTPVLEGAADAEEDVELDDPKSQNPPDAAVCSSTKTYVSA